VLPARSLPPTPENTRDRGRDECRILQDAQIDEPDTVRKGFQQIGSGLECQARLADASRSRDGQQPDLLAAEKVHHPRDLIFPPEKRSRLQGQVVGPRGQRPDRGEVGWQIGMEQLKDALGSVQITERMLAQIA
jgi:hypothetical protein